MNLLKFVALRALEGFALVEEDLRDGDEKTQPPLDLHPGEPRGFATGELQVYLQSISIQNHIYTS